MNTYVAKAAINGNIHYDALSEIYIIKKSVDMNFFDLAIFLR